MKENYQKQTDAVLQSLSGVPKLLLHVCCAPCSSYVLEYLSEYFEITVFYYNPNIQPESEYRCRVQEEQRFISEIQPKHPVHFIEGAYDVDRFIAAAKGLEHEPEGGARCEKCFALRLNESARLCKEGDYDYLTTTLTISPLKNAEVLNAVGKRAAQLYGVKWLPSDFKKKGGYQRSIVLSREHKLYRQNYCGCVYSKAQSERKTQNDSLR